ncbi:hypothetical protein BCR36DRAFT_409805 [Piromyces finnis]|uniref:Uncharacterized protein n=1 Tax=Piromyces finnis TaxID=1754191 RepID=A0A1Y1VHU9_9FUNG|nr:hypothetical protein BCR36DRAFT_409805 [Piromyces finnis]|eukprot:ORX56611.1 hypothetical protein BCR36DRAFT_409805 [Piromyces finnis]
MAEVKKKNLYSIGSTFINLDDDPNELKKSDSDLSIYDIEELTISSTLVSNNRISRSTQTINNDIIDIKNIEALYKNLNKNIKTAYNVIKIGYSKKVNDSVNELHRTIIQQLLQIEKAYKLNINTIRQAYHTELNNFKIQFKNYRNETIKSEHDKELTKIINEKNYYAEETVRLKKIINDQNNKLFRLKYILVQKYPAKVKQLFSEKDADLSDILDPRDVQIESAMQHLQIDKMKKENEIRNLKKKLVKVKNDLCKKYEDETEYIPIEKHNKIIKEIQEDYELSISLLEKKKDKEINRLYNDSKKLKSIYEAQLLSIRKLQQKSNYNQVMERQNKILELSKFYFPKITKQSLNVSNGQIDAKEDKNPNNNESNNNDLNNSVLKNSSLLKNNLIQGILKDNPKLIFSNNDLISNKPTRPFTSYFPSEYVRKKD